MNASDSAELGKTMERLVEGYRHTYSWPAVAPHRATLTLFSSILRYGKED